MMWDAAMAMLEGVGGYDLSHSGVIDKQSVPEAPGHLGIISGLPKYRSHISKPEFQLELNSNSLTVASSWSK